MKWRGLAPEHAALLRPAVLAPTAVLFSIMVAHALLETARDALFLAHLGPERLGWAYLAIAVISLLAVAAVRGWHRVRDPRRMLVTFLIGAVVGTSALALALPFVPALIFVLYVWIGIVATLVVPSFWTMLDRSLEVAEAKQVFGAIGAGGVLGAMVGSAIASALGHVMPARQLVSAGAIAFGVAAVAAIVLAPRSTLEEPPWRQHRMEVLSRRSRGYVRLLLVLGLISTIVLTLGDLTFKRVLAERLDPGDMASVFGAIYTALNAVALVVQLVVTPRLLARWGVGGTLTILPLILVASALGFAITGAMIAVIALKLGDGGLRHSLHRIGSEILYLPVPAAVRDGWKLVADTVGQRGGQALAALTVFAISSFGRQLGSMTRMLAIVTAVAAVVWLVAIVIVRRSYVAQFRETLQAGEIQRDVAIPDLDADSIELLTQSLSSPDEVEALAALDLLARRAHLPALVLYHPRETVVRHALSLLGGELRPEVARVIHHLLEHSDPLIRAAALAASSRTGYHHDHLVAAISDPNVDVRAAALVGLASDPQHATKAEHGIAALAGGATADRIALAHAISYMPHDRFRPLLYDLLARREPPVMRSVVQLLARIPTLADIDRLLPFLEEAHVRGDVRRVFMALGERGLDRLIAALDDPRTSLQVRRHLPRSISRFRSRAAAAALVARLPREPDGTTEYKILRALGRMRANDPGLPIIVGPIRDYIRRALADAARYSTLADRLAVETERSSSSDLIAELLAEKRWWAIEHVFRALGILLPRAGLRSVHDALLSTQGSRRSAARELLEAVVFPDMRTPLLAVIDDLPAAERRARLVELAPGPFESYDSFVAALLTDPSESLRCVVAHHIAERRMSGLRSDLARLRPLVGPPLVIQAFDQAMARLDA